MEFEACDDCGLLTCLRCVRVWCVIGGGEKRGYAQISDIVSRSIFVKHFPTHCRLRPYRFDIVLGCLCVQQRAIYNTHHCGRTPRCSAAQTFPKRSDRLQKHSFTIRNASQINDPLGSHVLRAKRASKSQSQNVSYKLGVCLRIDLTDESVHFC